MRIISINQAVENIRKEYNSDTAEWRVLRAPSEDSMFNFFVFHKEEAWIIKQDTIFSPKRISVAAKSKATEAEEILVEEYGFDKSNPTYGKRLIGRLQTHSIEAFIHGLVYILNKKPVTEKEAYEIPHVEGPVVEYYHPLSGLVKGQSELEKTLRKEIVKHPDYNRGYI